LERLCSILIANSYVKVKCDRGQPACGWCVKNKQSCEYKERKKPGLRAGYGKELETRLAEQATILGTRPRVTLILRVRFPCSLTSGQIRDIIARHETAISQLTRNSNTLPAPLPSLAERSLFQPPPSPHGSRHDAALFLQKPTPFSRSPFQTSYPNILPGSPSTLRQSSYDGGSVVDRLTDPPTLPRISATSREVVESSTLSIPDPPHSWSVEEEFPDYDLCFQLVELYFEYVNPYIPVLHKRSTSEIYPGH
jgi:hypothetical protein